MTIVHIYFGKNDKRTCMGQRICFRFYQYLPMMETHVIGYQVKATPVQVTMMQVK